MALQQSTNYSLRELALFGGCGGGILAAKLLGWRTVCAVEIEPYRAERLAQRQNEGFLPPFPIWNGDIADFDGRPWRGIIDVVSGGFPCQDISAANPNAEGITGPRSGLYKQMLRIIREVEPEHVLMENSPMLTRRGLGRLLRGLAELGFDARWGVLGANDLGGFHIRKRIYIVGHSSRARLEGQCRIRGPKGLYAGPAAAETGIRVLADCDCARRRAEHEQQIGSAGRAREQSGRRCDDVADGLSFRQSSARNKEINEPANGEGQATRLRRDHAVCDALWSDREFIRCTDGKLRAIKPGICGMAHGVANRVDRISAIGDGQVPVVVAAAWNILSELLRNDHDYKLQTKTEEAQGALVPGALRGQAAPQAGPADQAG